MEETLRNVRVDLGRRAYDIQVGTGILDGVGPFITSCGKVTHAVVMADENVEPLYAVPLAENLAEEGVAVDLVAVPAGERSKSVYVANELWNTLLEEDTDRSSIVVAVGGGVVGDLAGFVAATFVRGLPFFQVPTTLLAQVDSSVGGKVGVNLPQAKNKIGAFWQPRGVMIDTDVLATLPTREYRAGLGEVVKYDVIQDAEFFAYLEENVEAVNRRDSAVLRHVVGRCCRLKADVVEIDEREETGARAILNYGHTFAHALETAGRYEDLLHGEAVGIGMMCAARLAEALGRIDAELTGRQHDLLAALGVPTAVPDWDRDPMLDVMRHDKKVAHGKLRFVLPTRLGHVELVEDVDPKLVREAFDH